jgi:lincosamide nucleotidyltransferase A/C/D/E
MTEAEVVEILDRLEVAGVEAWVDGGWGVDALLGYASRRHADLDLVVRRDDLGTARRALGEVGYVHAADEAPGLPARLVLRDREGRQVDFHPVEFDASGDAWQDLGDGRHGRYPAGGLRAVGSIGGRRVRCLTPELQLAHHQGYELPEHERLDVELLAERFRLE